ncbi:MAG: patatin-like phospholipase family protein [Proteobacteria bacterium]|nr:patatin-like phospholipase family protein [Pseudomonadota bacterium]
MGHRRSALHAALAALATLALAACASRPVNAPIDHVDPHGGYRVLEALARPRPHNDPDTLLLLAFSGGGTRAAALSYGVLEALRDTPVVQHGVPHAMLDEVDVITGVSGGSFTALSYALYGNDLFDLYPKAFLKRDVQGKLISLLFDPFVGGQTIGGTFGRSELAEHYYDEILFHGATFGDLMGKDRPVVVTTATDLSSGARLGFIQGNFDVLCSDLSSFKLARAAAASSAVPIVLSPVTINDYGGRCGFAPPPWLAAENTDSDMGVAGLASERLADLRAFADGNARPYIHLVDGGVADNLGLRAIIETLQELEVSPQMRALAHFDSVRRIAIVIVNARSAPTTRWDQSEAPPGPISQLLQASNVPIDRYSYDSVELVRGIVSRWKLRRDLAVAEARLAGASAAAAAARYPDVAMYVIDVSFDAIADAKTRHYFQNLPTSFVLDDEQVDRLRAEAGALLRASPQFQSFRRALETLPAAPGVPPQP